MKNGIGSVLAVAIGLAVMTEAADCPRFRGPAGDGQFSETGLLKQWPQGGPKLAVDGSGPRKRLLLGHCGRRHDLCDRNGRSEAGDSLRIQIWTGRLKWKTPYGPELVKARAVR